MTEREERDLWRYLNAIRDDVVYGYGDASTSEIFGRAPENLVDSAVLRLRNGGRVPRELRPEDHSPLEGYAKVTTVPGGGR